ncbi:MAG TPA: lipid II flippase MurJ, partial [Burkholderiaceae bacterium]|nr:lipid II flippase MurJ [Burkholderiaceae bacterium]
GWGRFVSSVVLACMALGALLWWAAGAVDWIGSQSRPWWRAGVLAGVLGSAALLYFGVLAACGMRLREFMRRA